MKKILLSLFLLSTAFAGKGQNLVQNGGFEQFSSCPNNLGQINLAINWHNPTGTSPDYYNQCAPATWVGVPANYLGYQYAKSGVAYAGLHRYVEGITNYREYLEGTLTTPLVAGACYHLEMYMNLSNRSAYTATNIGVYFSNTLISVTGTGPLPYTPQINNTSGIYPDTVSWALVSENFTAAGGESYFIIGNFNPDNLTDTILYNSQSTYFDTYVYIDDVCLTSCGSSCFTAIEEQNQNQAIKIYPNPVNDKLNITINNNELSEIILYDTASRKLLQREFTNSVSLNTEQLAKGIYLYEVKNKNSVIKKGKVVKE